MSIVSEAIRAPSFYIYDVDGNKVKTLRLSFLKKLVILEKDYLSGTLHWEGIEYELVIDDEQILVNLAVEKACHCIVSFQVHYHGKFAVCRKLK